MRRNYAISWHCATARCAILSCTGCRVSFRFQVSTPRRPSSTSGQCGSVKALRWPAVGLNVWMIVATPVLGAHYFIDVIGGAVLAGVSIALATRLIRSFASEKIATAGNGLFSGTLVQYGGGQ